MTEFRAARVPSGARALPGSAYTSAEVFAAEGERVFGRRWLCAGRATQIGSPGEYVTLNFGAESLILVRDRAGRARAFFNVCRHRGARLCEAPDGRYGSHIRCPYHGWAYGLDGRLLGAPRMEGTEGFDPAGYPLHAAALEEWEGFLFVNLARDAEPFASALPALDGRFNAWAIGTLTTARRIEYDVRANWKVIGENYSECLHCPLVHPELTRLSPPTSGRNDLLEGPVLGGYMTLTHPGGSMTTTGRRPRPPLGTVAGEDLNRVYYYAVFPNLLLSLHPDYVMAHTLWPESPGQTRVVCEWYIAPQVAAGPAGDLSDAVDFWDLTNRQDWAVGERTQLGVASRAYVPGPLSDAEGMTWAFDQEYLQAMEQQGVEEA